MEQTIEEKIRQRRRQMLVHSYIYYERNTNIVSDSKWSQWAMELVQLQKDYPEESSRVEFAEQFQDWDGSSGAFLKFPKNIISVAERLIAEPQKSKPKQSISKAKSGSKKIKSSTRSLF